MSRKKYKVTQLIKYINFNLIDININEVIFCVNLKIILIINKN